jgi:hypothetical protein
MPEPAPLKTNLLTPAAASNATTNLMWLVWEWGTEGVTAHAIFHEELDAYRAAHTTYRKQKPNVTQIRLGPILEQLEHENP